MSFAGTGISELDRLLGGGIRRGHTVLLEADVGTLHELFLFTFMKDGLDKGESICYVSMNKDLDAFTHMVQHRAPYVLEALGKNFFLVDLQTKREVEPSDALKGGCLTVLDPSNPSLVAASINSFFGMLKETGKRALRFVRNSLSDAIMTYGLAPVYQMNREFLPFAKRSGYVGIDVIHPKIHTRQDNATIEYAYDGVIELSTALVGSRLQKYLQVKDMTGARFSSEMVPYEEIDGRIALWTRLIEDFEAMKMGLTLESEGTLRIMGAKGQFISERSLANLTMIILKEVGYERGGSMLYEYTRASAGRTAEEFSKVQRVSGPDLLRTYLKVSQMTGSGVFTHISLDAQTGVAVVRGTNLIPSTLRFDRQVHFRDAGAIAGVLGFITGKPYKVEETECFCKGGQYCEFVGKPVAGGESDSRQV